MFIKKLILCMCVIMSTSAFSSEKGKKDKKPFSKNVAEHAAKATATQNPFVKKESLLVMANISATLSINGGVITMQETHTQEFSTHSITKKKSSTLDASKPGSLLTTFPGRSKEITSQETVVTSHSGGSRNTLSINTDATIHHCSAQGMSFSSPDGTKTTITYKSPVKYEDMSANVLAAYLKSASLSHTESGKKE